MGMFGFDIRNKRLFKESLAFRKKIFAKFLGLKCTRNKVHETRKLDNNMVVSNLFKIKCNGPKIMRFSNLYFFNFKIKEDF